MNDSVEEIKEWALENFFTEDQAEKLKSESLTEIIYQIAIQAKDLE